jgi:hypothetical protein
MLFESSCGLLRSCKQTAAPPIQFLTDEHLKKKAAVPRKPSAVSRNVEKADANGFACLIVFNFDLDILASPAF